MVVGNKSDLEDLRIVSKETAEEVGLRTILVIITSI